MSEQNVIPASDKLTAALASLEASRQLLRADKNAYYDEVKDTKNKKTYYASLSPKMTPKERFYALNALLAATHTTQPPYNPSVELYSWIDLHPDQTLHSIYSDQNLDPEQTIRGDFEMLLKIQGAIASIPPQDLMLSPEEFNNKLQAIFDKFPFNCEHTVPQGWFARREPMRGDLHHLFACEPACNAFRGSLPFFDFLNSNEETRDHCGRREHKGFEPVAGRGAVARAMLYFFIRYYGELTLREPQKKQLKDLLLWHKRFPVTLYEKHRNLAIYERQGNRNPLIDYPEFADEIDFSFNLIYGALLPK